MDEHDRKSRPDTPNLTELHASRRPGEAETRSDGTSRRASTENPDLGAPTSVGPGFAHWSFGSEMSLGDYVEIVPGVERVATFGGPRASGRVYEGVGHVTVVCLGGEVEAVRDTVRQRIAMGLTFDLIHWPAGRAAPGAVPPDGAPSWPDWLEEQARSATGEMGMAHFHDLDEFYRGRARAFREVSKAFSEAQAPVGGERALTFKTLTAKDVAAGRYLVEVDEDGSTWWSSRLTVDDAIGEPATPPTDERRFTLDEVGRVARAGYHDDPAERWDDADEDAQKAWGCTGLAVLRWWRVDVPATPEPRDEETLGRTHSEQKRLQRWLEEPPVRGSKAWVAMHESLGYRVTPPHTVKVASGAPKPGLYRTRFAPGQKAVEVSVDGGETWPFVSVPEPAKPVASAREPQKKPQVSPQLSDWRVWAKDWAEVFEGKLDKDTDDEALRSFLVKALDRARAKPDPTPEALADDGAVPKAVHAGLVARVGRELVAMASHQLTLEPADVARMLGPLLPAAPRHQAGEVDVLEACRAWRKALSYQGVGTKVEYEHACAEAWSAVEAAAKAHSPVPTEGWVRYDEIDATALGIGLADERTVSSCKDCPLGFPGDTDPKKPFDSCAFHDYESMKAPPADCPLRLAPTLVTMQGGPS